MAKSFDDQVLDYLWIVAGITSPKLMQRPCVVHLFVNSSPLELIPQPPILRKRRGLRSRLRLRGSSPPLFAREGAGG